MPCVEVYSGKSQLPDGTGGDDTFEGSVPGSGQIHGWGKRGDDHFDLGMENQSGRQGHHVYGNAGIDTFNFVDIDETNSPVVGRIDDFDPNVDVLQIEGTTIDLLQNSSGTVSVVNCMNETYSVSYRVVEFQSSSAASLGLGEQQFLVLNNVVMYALEGARLGVDASGTIVEEQHFFELPTSGIASLDTVNYTDPQNFTPPEDYANIAIDDSRSHIGATTWNGGSGNDFLFCADNKNQTIYGGDGHDVINANDGLDVVYGGTGDDIIAGGLDSDQLYGGSGHDRIYGGDGVDTIFGDSGDDYIRGGTENDVLYGQGGKDNISAEGGDDTVYGGSSDDKIRGGYGNDVLVGGSGKDNIHGGLGSDVIRGGSEQDVVAGASGSDVFLFQTGDVSWGEVISDFSIDEDKIKFNIDGVDELEDLTIYRKDEVGDFRVAFKDPNISGSIILEGTNESDSDLVWSDIHNSANFIFA